jgi:hypothetical protein
MGSGISARGGVQPQPSDEIAGRGGPIGPVLLRVARLGLPITEVHRGHVSRIEPMRRPPSPRTMIRKGRVGGGDGPRGLTPRSETHVASSIMRDKAQ